MAQRGARCNVQIVSCFVASVLSNLLVRQNARAGTLRSLIYMRCCDRDWKLLSYVRAWSTSIKRTIWLVDTDLLFFFICPPFVSLVHRSTSSVAPRANINGVDVRRSAWLRSKANINGMDAELLVVHVLAVGSGRMVYSTLCFVVGKYRSGQCIEPPRLGPETSRVGSAHPYHELTKEAWFGSTLACESYSDTYRYIIW